MNQRDYAEKYISLGFQPIPLDRKLGGGKGLEIKGWQEKEFKPNDFGETNNIGLNLKLSGLNNVDPDSKNAVYFAKLFLPKTSTLGLRQFNGNKKIEGTSYFYKGEATENISDRKYPKEMGG